jgi:predicted DNA-binding transcriptional regulator
MSIQKTDAMRWTSRMDDCLKRLEVSEETSSDVVLAVQVRYQLVMEQVYQAGWAGLGQHYATTDPASGLTAPFISALRHRMEEIQYSIPIELKDHRTF